MDLDGLCTALEASSTIEHGARFLGRATIAPDVVAKAGALGLPVRHD